MQVWILAAPHIPGKHDIAWANWDYRGGFGFVGRGNQSDQEFIKVLVGQ